MLRIFKDDPYLIPFESQIMARMRWYKELKKEIESKAGSIEQFAEGYKEFGFVRDDENKKWTFTEWLPAAKQVFLIGDFNGWQKVQEYELQSKDEYGRWSIDFPDRPDGSFMIPHGSKHRLCIQGQDGKWFDRVPAWALYTLQDPSTNLFNGVFWHPPPEEQRRLRYQRPPRPENLKIYEAHVGMGSIHPRVASYAEFKDDVLPRIKRLGYNAVQLMATAEHAFYGSFGYHVTSYFAPSSRQGTPEQLKELIDAAHAHGILVLMDLVHAHMSSNWADGIACMDGTDHCYTHGGEKGKQTQWDSNLFHFTKWEVLRFLLSNIRFWLEEYGFDGFRFDGVTSMLYHSHGINKGYSGGYHEYFGDDADQEAHVYCMLANELVHNLLPASGLTIAEDVSGMPTLCRRQADGGFGFDYRLAMAIPDMWIKLIKESSDDDWDIGHIVFTLQNRRWKEAVVAYAESHDQCIVGDKTTACWLMDKEMYTHMSTLSDPSMIIDRGLALHKMIRLVVLGLGGEAYLNFMGNEFGHPEWVDFPTQLNNWSYHHCRRRFDLAEDPMLKYKYFDLFDEVMQACENRFRFVCSPHQFCTKKDNGDKVMIFERGDLLFVFNFHPTNSYTDYRIGHHWNEGMKVVLDSDEARFGGRQRLEWGHANAHPPGPAWDNRYHSTQLYLPSRTCQVLARESILQGGVTIRLSPGTPMRGDWPCRTEDLRLIEISEDGSEQPGVPFEASPGGPAVTLTSPLPLTFKVKYAAAIGATDKILSFAPPAFVVHFTGDYLLNEHGSLICLGERGAPALPVGDPPAPGCVGPPSTTKSNGLRPRVKNPSISLIGPSDEPVAEPKGKNVPDECIVVLPAKEEPQTTTQAAAAPPTSAGYPQNAAAIAEPPVAQLPVAAAKPPAETGKTQDVTSAKEEPEETINMERIYSLSALDCLLSKPEDKVRMRKDKEEQDEKLNIEQKVAKRIGYQPRHSKTSLVVVTSEVNPWSKTGGLSMVAASYGFELAVSGHRTMVVSPRYAGYDNCNYLGSTQVWLDGKDHEVGFYHQWQSYGNNTGCDYIFVEHLSYHRAGGLYWDPREGREYGDNLFRFALLSLAALEAPLILNLGGSTYGEDVLFLANDWQTGLVPAYITHKYRRNGVYRGARTMFVIHNIGYQGKYSMTNFPPDAHLGLPRDAAGDLMGPDGPDCINLLSCGIKLADRVLTVSPNYAAEIQTPHGGEGLHGILCVKGSHLRLGGILNGISDEWNPSEDPHIATNYNITTMNEGKAACKAALQAKLGLHEDPTVALLGFCGRLTSTKGIQLIVDMIPWVMHDEGNGVTGRVQIIMMGKGDVGYENRLAEIEGQYKGRICSYVGFDPKVEHQMMAACDFLLMPSQYEPCGLPQMYAQAYGTLPIVHETGGLKDSVKGLWDTERDRGVATGFLFGGFNVNSFKERIWQGIEIFHKQKDLFKQLRCNAISENHYWPLRTEEYERHIDWTLDAEACRP